MAPKRPRGDLADDAADWIKRASDFVDFIGGDGDGPPPEDPEPEEDDGTEECEPVGVDPASEPTRPSRPAPPPKKARAIVAVVLVPAGAEEAWRNQVDRILGPLTVDRPTTTNVIGVRNSLVELIRQTVEENGSRIIEVLS